MDSLVPRGLKGSLLQDVMDPARSMPFWTAEWAMGQVGGAVGELPVANCQLPIAGTLVMGNGELWATVAGIQHSACARASAHLDVFMHVFLAIGHIS